MPLLNLKNAIISSAILFFYALSFASLIAGEVYKWVDENGKVHYSDKPFHKDARPMKLKNQPTKKQVEQARKQAETLQVRMNDLKQEQYDKAEQDIVDKNKAIKLSNTCKTAKKRLKMLNMQARIFRTDKQGNRHYMDDEERQKQISKLNQNISLHCKQ